MGCQVKFFAVIGHACCGCIADHDRKWWAAGYFLGVSRFEFCFEHSAARTVDNLNPRWGGEGKADHAARIGALRWGHFDLGRNNSGGCRLGGSRVLGLLAQMVWPRQRLQVACLAQLWVRRWVQ